MGSRADAFSPLERAGCARTGNAIVGKHRSVMCWEEESGCNHTCLGKTVTELSDLDSRMLHCSLRAGHDPRDSQQNLDRLPQAARRFDQQICPSGGIGPTCAERGKRNTGYGGHPVFRELKENSKAAL